MTWPTTQTTTHLDSNSDSVTSARAEIYNAVVAVNDIIGSRAAASGIASLDATGKIPAAELPAEITSTGGQDLTLTPASTRVAVNNILNLEPRTVTQLTSLATPVTGDVAYCSNGNAGSACLAVYSGSAWKQVALGATISAT